MLCKISQKGLKGSICIEAAKEMVVDTQVFMLAHLE